MRAPYRVTVALAEKRYPAVIVHVFAAVFFTVMTVGLAKFAQYSMVEAYGDKLGFDLAALTGVFPVLVVALLIDRQILRVRGLRHG